MAKLTHARLREILIYEPDTGTWRHRISRPGVRAGAVAGRLDRHGYWCIQVDGGYYTAGRLAWLYMTGDWPAQHVDHRDLDKTNNRWGNLRSCSPSQNNANRRKHGNARHGLPKGVELAARGRRKYVARIGDHRNGTREYLGAFHTPDEAHAAYVRAAEERWGEFARAA